MTLHKTILVSNTSESEKFFNNLTSMSAVVRERRGKQNYISQRMPLEGAQSLFAMWEKNQTTPQKPKKQPLKYNSDNQRGSRFTIPVRKSPESFF